MGIRIMTAAFILASAIMGQSTTALAQDSAPDLGRVASNMLCTEAGAIQVFRALSRPKSEHESLVAGADCRARPIRATFKIVSILDGPHPDHDGDAMYVVEVWSSRHVERRFTIAWPGFNARLIMHPTGMTI